jgi:type II/III secretion system protein
MTKRSRLTVIAAAIALASAGRAHGQTVPIPNDPAANAQTATPLKVQVVISRYDGEKKISSMPYTLSVNAGRMATIRMGTRVPVVATSYTPVAAGGAGVNPLTSYQYTDVGTNIDCTTGALSDGRFRLELNIEDSSLYPEDQPRTAAGDRPLIRSFRAGNSLVLKDGQTAQFTTAVDKMTGVVTKVDVTLNVVR